MKDLCSRILYVALCGLVGATNAASSSEAPKATDRVLAAMDRTPTEGHPDQSNEFAGMHRYTAGDYPAAMKYFLASARYADKVSQLSIGLMYLNGQGVTKDPVTAFAWLDISAERHYPQFVVTRDRVWSELDAAQREQAEALVKSLAAEYGDAVAKPRMALALRQGLAQQTGNGLGYDKSGAISSLTVDQFEGHARPPHCQEETVGGATQIGCGDIYADWQWNPKTYFQVRDAAWNGKVTVGTLQSLGKSTGPSNASDVSKSGQ